MRQYSFSDIELGWNGLDFKPGLASDAAAISETRNAPNWTQKVTGTGKVVRAKGTDRSGTVSVVVDQTSVLHQSLRLLTTSDTITESIVNTMTLYDGASKETAIWKNAYIAVEPDEVRGSEAVTFTWVFNYETAVHNTSINANIVGS